MNKRRGNGRGETVPSGYCCAGVARFEFCLTLWIPIWGGYYENLMPIAITTANFKQPQALPSQGRSIGHPLFSR